MSETYAPYLLDVFGSTPWGEGPLMLQHKVLVYFDNFVAWEFRGIILQAYKKVPKTWKLCKHVKSHKEEWAVALEQIGCNYDLHIIPSRTSLNFRNEEPQCNPEYVRQDFCVST